jgi:hypothetical protein
VLTKHLDVEDYKLATVVMISVLMVVVELVFGVEGLINVTVALIQETVAKVN